MLNWIIANAEMLFGGIGITIIVYFLKLVPKIRRWVTARFFSQSNNIHSFPAKSGEFNDKFYGHFEKCFRNAKQDIYITGDGFGCKNAEGRERARRFANMMRDALARGVDIVRIETNSDAGMDWAQELAAIKEQYGERFELFVIGGSAGVQLSSVCVFDPESPSDCIVEMMLSISTTVKRNSTDLAGTGIFISGEQALAKTMRNRINQMAEMEEAVEAKNNTDVVNLVSGSALYFAYGSNMSKSQMKKRIQTAEFIDFGFLEDHRLKFNREGSYRSGGVASVEPGEGRVWGAVWKMPTADLQKLTKIEDPTAYKREVKTVTLRDKTSVSCHTYVAIPQTDFIPPEQNYIETILTGAREIGLPKDYIDYIASIETLENTVN